MPQGGNLIPTGGAYGGTWPRDLLEDGASPFWLLRPEFIVLPGQWPPVQCQQLPISIPPLTLPLRDRTSYSICLCVLAWGLAHS